MAKKCLIYKGVLIKCESNTSRFLTSANAGVWLLEGVN